MHAECAVATWRQSLVNMCAGVLGPAHRLDDVEKALSGSGVDLHVIATTLASIESIEAARAYLEGVMCARDLAS